MPKFLAIDDKNDNLIRLKAILNDIFTDAVVLTALTGTKGIELATAEKPDVILLDIVMAGMDGFEVCRRLKDDAILREIPVIFITPLQESKENRQHALEIGAEAFLSKPIDIIDLTAQIRAMLKIKAANEKERLAQLVAKRTLELEQSHIATLKLVKMRTMFEQAPLGIALIDSLTGQIYDANPQFAKIIGRSQKEIATLDWMSITHPNDIPKDLDNMALLNAGKIDSFHMNKRYIKLNGDVVWLSITIAPTQMEGKNNLCHLCMIDDITKRKQADKEYEKWQNQLQQAQKMEAVGLLAGGVAHDYNNISSIIIGYAELALDKLEARDPLYGDLMEILTAARRSTDITSQLLTFAHKQTVAPKVLDLNDSIGNLLKMLQRLIGEDINLVWIPGIKIRPLKIDPSQINQIMANLCLNARDAIANVGQITVETKNINFDQDDCEDQFGFLPGEYIMLAISDNGCGMTPETRYKIFEPFFTTKDVGKGTGLGLSTVYSIVKQNNGFVSVYSETKQGTTFRIYLPIHQGPTSKADSQETLELPLSRGETVLLVEDEDSILKIVTRILEKLGYAVLCASSPVEAIRLAEEHANEIKLLITDVVMPEMNGRELAERLQSLYPNLKSLFMSGYTANIIANRGILESGVNFIAKPFSSKELALKVREVLDQDKS